MPTDPITRLNAALEGRYRIESELGEGGMATVYGSILLAFAIHAWWDGVQEREEEQHVEARE